MKEDFDKDCPECGTSFYSHAAYEEHIECCQDEQQQRKEARVQWIEQKAQIANDDKVGSNIDKFLDQHPTAEFKKEE